MLVITIGSKVKAVLYVCTYLYQLVVHNCQEWRIWWRWGSERGKKPLHPLASVMFVDDDWRQ